MTNDTTLRAVYSDEEIEGGRRVYGGLMKNLMKNFSSNDLINLRPKIGVCSSRFFNLVGKKLNKSKKKNDPIFIRDISDE